MSPAVLEASYKLAGVAPGRLSKSIFPIDGQQKLMNSLSAWQKLIPAGLESWAFRAATTELRSLLRASPACFNMAAGIRCPWYRTVTGYLSRPNAAAALRAPLDIPAISLVCGRPRIGWGTGAISRQSLWNRSCRPAACWIPPPGYLQELQRIARQHGVLLIADEAQTGFGRTGKWFAVEHHGFEPDILTVSKSAGNGFPVAAVTTTPEIAEKVVGDGLWNLTSHQSDPVGAAAAAAVIDIVREENLVDRAHEAGNYFMEQLRSLCGKHSFIGSVRGQGLMIGFDLIVEDASQTEEIANDFMYGCRQRGVHLTFGYGSRSFRIIPPLTISHAEIDRAIDAMDRSLAALGTKKTSKRENWPKNPCTSLLYRDRPLKRVISGLWRSAPEDWVRKAKELAHEKLGSA